MDNSVKLKIIYLKVVIFITIILFSGSLGWIFDSIKAGTLIFSICAGIFFMDELTETENKAGDK